MRKIKSSALGYAISFLLLVGLITSGALFIAAFNKVLERSFSKSESLLFDNFSALKKASYNPSSRTNTIYHKSGDTSFISSQAWGAFKVINVLTKNKFRAIKKSALVGYSPKLELPSLYCVDRSSGVQLAGDTKLEGLLYLPKKGLIRARLTGKNYQYPQLNYGQIKESDIHLPSLNQEGYNIDRSKVNVEILSELKDSVHSFFNPTQLYQSSSPIFINGEFHGNLIIQSFDSIYIQKQAQLDHIILIAPKVRFESGFKGSVQVYAEQSITCEENVILDYPSSLIINSISSSSVSINLDQNSEVYGAVLVFGNGVRNDAPCIVMKDSEIGGLVYCKGQIQSSGNIYGSIFTEKFSLNYGGGKYVNYILDTHIEPIDLKDFAYPYWEDQGLTHPEIIEWF